MKGTKLKELRLAAGLTQLELAERANIGSGESGRVMVARYENDPTRGVPKWRVQALEKALKSNSNKQ